MRKNNGPNIDPWGTPALTGNQSDVSQNHLAKLAETCYSKNI